MKSGSLLLAALFLLSGSVHADKFHVMVDGVDDPSRDGRTWDTAWASLAFACERVPDDGGPHTILVRAGTYEATRTAYPKPGTTITGEGSGGRMMTRLVASNDWPLIDEFKPDEPPTEEFLIAFRKAEGITVRRMALVSAPEHRITGGIQGTASEGILLDDLRLEDFRWSGIFLNVCRDVEIARCRLENTSTERMRFWGGHIRTRYLKNSTIRHNRIIGRIGGGYGYKGGGHENVRLHHNFIDIRGGFGIESAHENEFGVEIDHNWINHCISIPKGVQSPDPAERGFDYTFWIHHNFLSHSYTIEGPRNHLVFEHNHVHISHPNGRVYTHHGGTNHGPVYIRHNVIENVDRALVWMNRGLAENIFVDRNTIFAADAGHRTGTLLGTGNPERFDNWVFRNNLVVAAWSRPRRVASVDAEVRERMIIEGNLFLNCLDIPPGNFVDNDPGVVREGAKPGPFWHPSGPESFLVDRGVDDGRPFEGKAPDIGAFEWGEEPWTLEEIPQPRW